MVDVLNDLSTLYQAQQQLADDQYGYLNHLIDLRTAAGTLSVDDLTQMNAWLSRPVRMPKQDEMVKPLKKLRHSSVVSAKRLKHEKTSKAVKKASRIQKTKTVAVPGKQIMLPSPA